jgi:hypothetical protein
MFWLVLSPLEIIQAAAMALAMGRSPMEGIFSNTGKEDPKCWQRETLDCAGLWGVVGGRRIRGGRRERREKRKEKKKGKRRGKRKEKGEEEGEEERQEKRKMKRKKRKRKK